MTERPATPWRVGRPLVTAVRAGVAFLLVLAGPGLAAPQDAPALPVSRLEGVETPVLPHVTPLAGRPDHLLPLLPVTRLDERGRGADLDGARTVSLTFSQPIPLTDVLMLLVQGTPFSIVTEASVTGTFSGELKDLSMRQALEAVLFPQDLEYAIEGTVVCVFPRRAQTRMFEVDHLNVRRALHRRTSATSSLDAQAGVDFTTSTESDFFADLDSGVRALLSPSGRHHVDRKAGLVHVTDFADRLDRVAAYLDAVHVRAARQVRLDARVFEVTLADRTSIDWNAVAARAGTAFRSTASGVATAGLRGGDLDALVAAIREQGTVRMIAAPRTLAMNNETAVMRAGVNEVSFGESASGKATTIAGGLTLTVTPQIAADGIVHLNVSPAWAEKTGQVRSGEAGNVPVLRVSAMDTLVRVQDGEAIVISGALSERTEARTSTGFSGLFGAQDRRTVHAEVVVLLSATVVVPGVIRTEGLQ